MINRKAFVPFLKVVYGSFNALYLLFFVLLLIDLYSSIEISSNLLRNIICYYLIWLIIPLWIINCFREKVWGRPFWIILPIVAGLFTLQPRNLFRGFEKWKTQTIEYRHVDNPHRQVVFQMLDIGIKRHRRRVELISIGPFLQKVKLPTINYETATDWVKVDEHINELGLKGG